MSAAISSTHASSFSFVVGTAVSVVLWFVLAYAFYAAIFAVAASLLTRQEDLNTVVMPTVLLLVAAFVVVSRPPRPRTGRSRR